MTTLDSADLGTRSAEERIISGGHDEPHRSNVVNRAAVLVGVGAFLPPRVVTNQMLAEYLDTSDEWIYTRTGIRQRHITDPGLATGDLAVEAGARALKSAEVGEVDMVIVATTTPDHPCPATAPAVATRLGFAGVPAYDVAAVCSGFIYGLASAAGAVAMGLADQVLVIGAETFSTIVDPGDRTTASIFADGAGAVLLRAGDPGEPGALRAFDLGSDGHLAGLIMVPGGGSRQRSGQRAPDPADMYFTMQGSAVFMHAVNRMTESSRTVLAATGWDIESVDHLVAHQANSRIMQAVADQLGLSAERAVMNIDRVGNTAAASIPIALYDAVREERLKTGDRMVLTAFGGGATWGTAALTWPDIVVD